MGIRDFLHISSLWGNRSTTSPANGTSNENVEPSNSGGLNDTGVGRPKTADAVSDSDSVTILEVPPEHLSHSHKRNRRPNRRSQKVAAVKQLMSSKNKEIVQDEGKRLKAIRLRLPDSSDSEDSERGFGPPEERNLMHNMTPTSQTSPHTSMSHNPETTSAFSNDPAAFSNGPAASSPSSSHKRNQDTLSTIQDERQKGSDIQVASTQSPKKSSSLAVQEVGENQKSSEQVDADSNFEPDASKPGEAGQVFSEEAIGHSNFEDNERQKAFGETLDEEVQDKVKEETNEISQVGHHGGDGRSDENVEPEEEHDVERDHVEQELGRDPGREYVEREYVEQVLNDENRELTGPSQPHYRGHINHITPEVSEDEDSSRVVPDSESDEHSLFEMDSGAKESEPEEDSDSENDIRRAPPIKESPKQARIAPQTPTPKPVPQKRKSRQIPIPDPVTPTTSTDLALARHRRRKRRTRLKNQSPSGHADSSMAEWADPASVIVIDDDSDGQLLGPEASSFIQKQPQTTTPPLEHRPVVFFAWGNPAGSQTTPSRRDSERQSDESSIGGYPNSQPEDSPTRANTEERAPGFFEFTERYLSRHPPVSSEEDNWPSDVSARNEDGNPEKDSNDNGSNEIFVKDDDSDDSRQEALLTQDIPEERPLIESNAVEAESVSDSSSGILSVRDDSTDSSSESSSVRDNSVDSSSGSSSDRDDSGESESQAPEPSENASKRLLTRRQSAVSQGLFVQEDSDDEEDLPLKNYKTQEVLLTREDSGESAAEELSVRKDSVQEPQVFVLDEEDQNESEHLFVSDDSDNNDRPRKRRHEQNTFSHTSIPRTPVKPSIITIIDSSQEVESDDTMYENMGSTESEADNEPVAIDLTGASKFKRRKT